MTDGVSGGGGAGGIHTDVEEPALFGYDWIIENFPHTYEEFCHQPRRGPYTSDKIEIKANNVVTSSAAGKDDETTNSINNLYGIWKMRLLCRGHPEPLSGPNGTVSMSPSNNQKSDGRNENVENHDNDEPCSSGSEDDETSHAQKIQTGVVGSTSVKPHKRRKHHHHRHHHHDPYPLVVTLRAMQLAEPVEAFVRLSLIDSSEQMIYSTRVRTKPHRFKETVSDATEFELRVTKEEFFEMPEASSSSAVIADETSKNSPAASSPASSAASSKSGKNPRGRRQNNPSTPGTPATNGVTFASSGPGLVRPASDELPTFPPPIQSIVDGTYIKPMRYFHRHRTLRLRLELQIHPGTLWSPLHDDMLKLFTDAEEQPDEAAVIADFRVIVGKSSFSTASAGSAGSSTHVGSSNHSSSGGGGLKSAPSAMRDLHNTKSGVRAAQHHQPPAAANKHSSPSADHHTHSPATTTNKFVKSFRCHRLILATRCPYFALMLSNKNVRFRETSRGEHHIVDVRPAVVRILLQFIYTDFTAVIGLDFDAAYELYSLAREYELNRLLVLCKFRMVQCVNAQNCLTAFRIGDLHDESVIKRVAIATVARQKHAVTQSASWADIMHNEPALLGKMLVEMAPMVGSLFSGPGSGVVNNYYHTPATSHQQSSTSGVFTRSSSSVIDPFSLQQLHGSGGALPQHQTLLSSIAPVHTVNLANHQNVMPLTTDSGGGVHVQKLADETAAALSTPADPSTSSALTPPQSSSRGGRRNNKKRKLN